MLSPLVVVYLGDERRGMDFLQLLNQRLRRPVNVLTGTVDELEGVLEDNRVDCVVAGSALDGAELQRIAFAVADHRDTTPLFDLTGGVAAVPDRLDVHRLEPETDPNTAVDRIVGEVLDTRTGDDRDREKPMVRGPVGYFAVDDEWRVRDWDPKLASWMGVRPSEAVGKKLRNVVENWEETELAEVCWRAYNSNDPSNATAFFEGTDRWFDVHAHPLETGGLECYLYDISEFTGPERSTGTTSERFETTLDRVTDAFFALDNEERFVFLNNRAEFLLDVETPAVIGRRFWDVFPAAITSRFYEKFKTAIETQDPTSFREYYQPLDRWFEVAVYPSSDGLSVFFRDVTEQVTLREKLEQLHDVTRELVVAESDTDVARRALAATEDVLGFPLAVVWRYNGTTNTLDPLTWSDEIDDRDVEMEPLTEDSEFIWDVYETGEPRVMDFVPATTVTSHHPGKVKSELLVRTGEYGVMGAYSDDRDAFDETDVELFRVLASTVESAFTRTERERQLARRNERLNEFASVVSHDLRNPLNVASSHIALARIEDDSTDHLDDAENALSRMEALIDDLLERARNDGEISRETLSLVDVAKEAWEGVDTTEATLVLGEDVTFNADPNRLKQLFENLFRNAVEHASTSDRSRTHDESVEGLKTSQTRSQGAVDGGGSGVTVTVDTHEEGFYVADDGPGIPEEQHEEIFDRGVSHSEGGTGYGLAIVADIVDGHGWSISVSESEDGGARFDVEDVHSLRS